MAANELGLGRAIDHTLEHRQYDYDSDEEEDLFGDDAY